MIYLRYSFRFLKRLIAGVFLFLFLYFTAAVFLMHLPSHTAFKETPGGIPIYVLSNGVHADIVLPAQHEMMNWTAVVSPAHVLHPDTAFQYVAMGWGDKGFYINTPTWADLKTSTALNAAFWLSTSAMHVTWRKAAPVPGPKCRRVVISVEQYKRLCAFILQTFERNSANATIYIKAKPYGYTDAFYEAKGRYNLFKTCNVWAGNALRDAGINTGMWTPLDESVFHFLPEPPAPAKSIR